MTQLCTDLTNVSKAKFVSCLNLAANGSKYLHEFVSGMVPFLGECPLVDMEAHENVMVNSRRAFQCNNQTNCEIKNNSL